jgi:hypothetical protein
MEIMEDLGAIRITLVDCNTKALMIALTAVLIKALRPNF